jgi:hypothetical protein
MDMNGKEATAIGWKLSISSTEERSDDRRRIW